NFRAEALAGFFATGNPNAEAGSTSFLRSNAGHDLMYRLLAWPVAGLWFLFRAAVVLWAALAIYYSNLPWPLARLALATAFAAFAVWAIWIERGRRPLLALFVLYLGVVAWWLSISPSHDRPWRAEVAVMPRAFIEGDRVHLTGVRNFKYRTR